MSRLPAALAGLALAAGAVAVAFTWQPGIASLFDDSVSYLVMAQAFSPWQPASPAIVAAFPLEKYPPLFPLLLAWGGGAYDWRIAHAWVALSFGASVFLLGLLARDAAKSAAIGFACALVYAWMPGAWLNVKGILSEFPYLALALAALLVHRRFAQRPDLARAAGLGVLLAAVFLTRTIGVALAAAIGLVELAHRVRGGDRNRFRGALVAMAIAALSGALWYALRPSGGDDAYASFGAGMARGAAEHGADWTGAIVANNLSALADAWLTALLIFWGEPWKPAFLLAALAGASGVAGTLWRAAKLEADAIYVAIFAAILAVWPFPGQMYRLALPAIPLVAMNAFWLWQRLLVLRMQAPRAARWSALAAVLPLSVCIPAALFYIAGRAGLPAPELAAGYRMTDIADFYRIPSRPAAEANALLQIGVLADLDQVRRTTPAEASVMWVVPSYVALLAGRRGVRLDRPADAAGLRAQVAAKRPDYLYLTGVHPRDTAHREGDPMASAAAARELGSVEWARPNAAGGVDALLVRIDAARVLAQ
ncbi:MAG TPA: hypothetical protein VLT89_07440 [Usitatibacter sp.]|nr:hypothetical protein [Usitatibacter sp.]